MLTRRRCLVCICLALAAQVITLGCAALSSARVPRSTSDSITAQIPTTGHTSTLVVIIIDAETYAALHDEIEQYAQDVRQDLGAKVIVAPGDWTDPWAVRTYLQDLRGHGLIGAVLVGQVPTTFFYARLQGPQFDRIPSDFYYMELDNDLDLDSSHVFSRPLATTSLLADIWVGRLKPPKDGPKGVAQLRSYFRRNHAFRAGEISSIPKMLILDDISSVDSSQSNANSELIDVGRLVQKSGLYRQEDTVLPDFMSKLARGDDDLARVLQAPYELAYLNHHGTPTTQQFGQSTLTSADIQQIGPKPLFYFIWSCSNGDFTRLDYIAGSYLFDGSGLTVFAPTVPVLGNIESGIPFLFPLSLGATFGEAYQYANFLSSMALLGDPTLRIRQPLTTFPILQLQQTELDFGEVPLTTAQDGALPLGAQAGAGNVEIEAFNTGQAPLVFSPIPSFVHSLRDEQWENRANNPVSFTFPDRIAPGESAALVFSFNPTQVGEYTGFVAFYTNDPHHTLVVISFRGTSRDQSDSADSSPNTTIPIRECTSTSNVLALNGPDRLHPGELVDLSMFVSPSLDFQQVNVRFVLPDGIELVEGEVDWTGTLLASDSLERKIVVLAPHPGDYLITGLFEGLTTDGTRVSDCRTLLLIVQE